MVRSQVDDSERLLVFNVGQQFIEVLLAESMLEFAQQDLDSFQKTVDISNERFRVGDLSEGDFLKIKLQLLQFQTIVSERKTRQAPEPRRAAPIAGLRVRSRRLRRAGHARLPTSSRRPEWLESHWRPSTGPIFVPRNKPWSPRKAS